MGLKWCSTVALVQRDDVGESGMSNKKTGAQINDLMQKVDACGFYNSCWSGDGLSQYGLH